MLDIAAYSHASIKDWSVCYLRQVLGCKRHKKRYV